MYDLQDSHMENLYISGLYRGKEKGPPSLKGGPLNYKIFVKNGILMKRRNLCSCMKSDHQTTRYIPD